MQTQPGQRVQPGREPYQGQGEHKATVTGQRSSGNRPDAFVIGGGLGGLSAAIRLSLGGFQVTLFEASRELGGKAGRVVIDGVEVDTGPSLLTLPQVFRDLFHAAGWKLEDELRLRPLSETFSYRWPDGTELCFHQDPHLRKARVEKILGAQAANEMESMLKLAEHIWQGASPHFLFSPKPTLRNLSSLSPWAFLNLPTIGAERTLASRVHASLHNPYLRDIFTRFATYNGSDPRHTPSTFLCIAHAEMGEQRAGLGSYGVEGGVFEIVRALERLAKHVGVRVRQQTSVDKIVIEDGAVAGVRLESGELLRCGTVISNADANWLEAYLLREANMAPKKQHLGLRLQARAKTGRWGKLIQDNLTPEAEPSTSGWNAIVRTRRQSDRAPHTVLFPRKYSDEFRALFDAHAVPEDPAIYICSPEQAHGRKGWETDEALFVMVNAPATNASKSEASDRQAKSPSPHSGDYSRLRSLVLERLRESKVVESDAHIVWERSPECLATRFPGSFGSLYGTASNSIRSAFARPGNQHPSYRGLYLASGSAHPGGGMPLAILSGKHAADAAIKNFGKNKTSQQANRTSLHFG